VQEDGQREQRPRRRRAAAGEIAVRAPSREESAARRDAANWRSREGAAQARPRASRRNGEEDAGRERCDERRGSTAGYLKTPGAAP
jgi:hypothetical protein